MASNTKQVETVEYSNFEESIKTGDLALLYREGQELPHYAIFIQHPKDDPDFPLLLLKGKTKPLPKEKFDKSSERSAHFTTAASRIFYGDFRKVLVKQLDYQPLAEKQFPMAEMMENIEKVNKIPFSEHEVEAIEKSTTAEERSTLLSALIVAHFYDLMMPGVYGDPSRVTPQILEGHLKLMKPKSIRLPSDQVVPLQCSLTAPHHSLTVKPYSDVAGTLNTGDIMLFSGKSVSSVFIKLFDRAQFSHVAIVIRSKYTNELMAWESSPDKGLIDIESGKIRNGVQLLPIRYLVSSGWYDHIAFRRLTGITDEKRKEMCKELLRFRKEVQGTPYEKNLLDLIGAAVDSIEELFGFFKNAREDLSSIFCSELVAAAYKRMGLLDSKTAKVSSEFTPDDFSSARHHELSLEFGELEPEVYVSLRHP